VLSPARLRNRPPSCSNHSARIRAPCYCTTSGVGAGPDGTENDCAPQSELSTRAREYTEVGLTAPSATSAARWFTRQQRRDWMSPDIDYIKVCPGLDPVVALAMNGLVHSTIDTRWTGTHCFTDSHVHQSCGRGREHATSATADRRTAW
jgi:hypothetical protein